MHIYHPQQLSLAAGPTPWHDRVVGIISARGVPPLHRVVFIVPVRGWPALGHVIMHVCHPQQLSLATGPIPGHARVIVIISARGMPPWHRMVFIVPVRGWSALGHVTRHHSRAVRLAVAAIGRIVVAVAGRVVAVMTSLVTPRYDVNSPFGTSWVRIVYMGGRVACAA